jgi:hypothetical protein
VFTGIGFFCAGIIMKDGLGISGLTTAASIWAASAIGVLLGVGFYAASLLLALLCMASMSLLHRLEATLPGRSTLGVCLSFGDTGPPISRNWPGMPRPGATGCCKRACAQLRQGPSGLALQRGGAGPRPAR